MQTRLEILKLKERVNILENNVRDLIALNQRLARKVVRMPNTARESVFARRSSGLIVPDKLEELASKEVE